MDSSRKLTIILTTLIAVNIATLIVGGYFIYKRGFSYLLNKSGIGRDKQDYAIMHYLERLELLRGLPVNSESILMIGDSLTEGAEWSEFFPRNKILNRGIGRDTTTGVLSRIETYLSPHPNKIFLMIGINDLLNGSNTSEIIDNYRTIINTVRSISPDTMLYTQAVLPVVNIHKVPIASIIELNSQLNKLSFENKCAFIDTFTPFTSTTGEPIKELFQKDGLHLSKSGYFIWIKTIEKAVIE